MMKKILITGVSGFVGGHLAEYLLSQKKYTIFGTDHLDEYFQRLAFKDKVNFTKLNLLDSQKVNDLINQIKPDYIFHLAAASVPFESFVNPAETVNNNVTSQLNIFEGMLKNNLENSRIMIISSAEVYGLIKPTDLPVNEDTKLCPTTPYAVSKITQDFFGLQYYIAHKLQCIRVRPFNHIGPRQSAKFVVADFAKQIAEIEKGNKEPIIYVGNLESKRDFTDVRDMVRAYDLLMNKGLPGEVYNIGYGESHSIREVLDILTGFSKTNIKVKVDPQKLRPSDIPDIVCDYTKMHVLTGWKPIIPLRQTLHDTLDYWRSII